MSRVKRRFCHLQRHLRVIAVIASSVLASCAGPPSAESINAEANALLDKGRYGEALVKYRASMTMARAQQDRPYEAIAMYGMARAYGYQCMYPESEQAFLASIALRQQIPDGPNAYITQNQLELARLYIGHRQWQKAIAQFEEALPRLEKLNVPSRSPVSFAQTLQDYALALRESGEQARTKEVTSRIQYLRSGVNAARERVQSFKPYPGSCSTSP